ncbi:translocation/assembly module TamB domain-containing protein, partial [uncultured Haemophilus sp.]|uniref:autotransporter assembly complex protein TamB n=1 Tax=uncultured Haemophilus sp. TaxID=237779 RepID=UPI0025EAAF10
DNKKIQATIGSHCWVNQDLDLCFPQQFTAGKNGEVPFELKRINLDLVNKLMGQDTLKGQLQSRGKVAWFADKPLQLNVAVEGNNIGVTQKLDYRTFKLDIPKLSVNADIQNNNLTLKSDINVQNQGRIGTDLKINDLSKGRQLGGTFTIEGLRLSLANQLFSSGESMDGEVVSRLNFGGNLEKPLLNGNFDIRNVKTKLKSLPFDVTDGQVAIRFNGTSSTLNGHVQTPDSKLNINGQANWANMDNWTAEVRAQADNFKVDIPSMAKLKVSPNVVVKASPKRLDLSGNVDIPWARIAIESLPDNAEPVSEDEVILNGPRKSKEELINRQFAAETKSGMQIQSDLKIKIGDDVHLNAYGLKTNLDGLLSVKQDKGKLGLFGQINLKNGRYASFGQDLLIRKGQVSFAGLPSQPMLNIEAIRNPEAMEDSKVTAGVKVIGMASSPQVTIFSDPAKSQDQALSYLLTGRSLENSGEAGSSGSVGAALLGLGLAKSGKVVGGIGEAFGIQDLNLGTAGVGDSSKVQVSGNIGKRLQVKYGVGLFDGLAEVTLRYRLMPQLYFQSVSSTNQVFDLLYQFEF